MMRGNTRTAQGTRDDARAVSAESIDWKGFIREVGGQFRNVCIVVLTFAALALIVWAGAQEINRLEQRIVLLEKGK